MKEYGACEGCGRWWKSNYLCPECVERLPPMPLQEFKKLSEQEKV